LERKGTAEAQYDLTQRRKDAKIIRRTMQWDPVLLSNRSGISFRFGRGRAAERHEGRYHAERGNEVFPGRAAFSLKGRKAIPGLFLKAFEPPRHQFMRVDEESMKAGAKKVGLGTRRLYRANHWCSDRRAPAARATRARHYFFRLFLLSCTPYEE
jgi:hypothetical protein